MTPSVLITIQLTGPLAPLASNDPFGCGEKLRAETADRIHQWFDAMSIPASALVRLTGNHASMGPAFLDIAVVVNECRLPFSRETVLRVFESTTMQAAHFGERTVASVRSWINDRIGSVHADNQQAISFLAEMVAEAIRGSSANLVSLEIAEAFLANENPDGSPRPDATFTRDVLRRLLQFPIPLRDRKAIVRWLLKGASSGWSVEQVAERLYDCLRSRSIEIRLPAAALGRLAKHGETQSVLYGADLKDQVSLLLAMMCDGLFYELGTYFTKVRLVSDSELAEPMFRFCVNDTLTPIHIGLTPDEIAVDRSAEPLLKQHNIATSQTRISPGNGVKISVVAAKEETELKKARVTTWNDFGYIILCLASELRRAAARLQSVADTEEMLANLSEAFPTLVNAVYARFDSLAVTRVFRHLLGQGIGIRDLRTILNLLVDFRYTTGVRSPTIGWAGREPYIYVGDAELTGEPYFRVSDPHMAKFDLSPMQLSAEPSQHWLDDGKLLAEFVKCGLKQYLTHKLTRGQNTLVCYLVDGDIEYELLEFIAGGRIEAPFAPERLSTILSSIGHELDEVGHFSFPPIAFIGTSPDVAILFQELIHGDFPEIFVVHRQAIEEDLNVQPIAHIPGLMTAE